ncbi:hypothetical protein SAMN02982931_04733 [Bauldia litoralis]|uniref:Uncharacterized protein n=1 Tax=Bauldia litoralis TaxID=665467 RepID=A0A1G6EN18_9HYPH|nr:hypothetical protein SAMN02982931_04733 [Bauldia litoralis]
MQHERICIRAKLGDNEGHTLRHESCNESDITGETIKLRDNNRALGRFAGCEGGCQLWSPVQGVRPFAGFDLGELGDEGVALCLGEARNGSPLRLDTEARSTLPGGGYAVVGDGMLHGDKLTLLPYKPHTTVCRLYVANTMT